MKKIRKLLAIEAKGAWDGIKHADDMNLFVEVQNEIVDAVNFLLEQEEKRRMQSSSKTK